MINESLHSIKIGILIDRLVPGGAEKIAIKQVQTFRKLGFDATLLVINRAMKEGLGEEPYKDLLSTIPVIYLSDRVPRCLRLSFKFPFFSFFSLFHITYALLIPFKVNAKEFDVIISHGTYSCFTAMSITRFKGIPYVAYIWDPINYILPKAYQSGPMSFFGSLLLPLAKCLDRKIVGEAKVLLVGGSAHNEYFTQISDKKIHIVPPAYDPIEKICDKKGDYILAVTAWKIGKDPEYFLQLLKIIPNFRLVMAGSWLSTIYKEEFKRKVKESNLSQRIQIVDHVSERELVELYAGARALIQISDDRGFGMPALEAAACGCTFIIPRGQGVCQLFQDGIDGFYTKEKDTDHIVELLKLLIKNEKTALEMGHCAWKTVKKKYSWERHVLELLRIINPIVEGFQK